MKLLGKGLFEIGGVLALGVIVLSFMGSFFDYVQPLIIKDLFLMEGAGVTLTVFTIMLCGLIWHSWHEEHHAKADRWIKRIAWGGSAIAVGPLLGPLAFILVPIFVKHIIIGTLLYLHNNFDSTVPIHVTGIN